jgi:hypothetical protein
MLVAALLAIYSSKAFRMPFLTELQDDETPQACNKLKSTHTELDRPWIIGVKLMSFRV